MAKSMTLEEVKKKKMQLELNVVNMFKQFELDTELKVGYIDIKRKRIKQKKRDRDNYNDCAPCGGSYRGSITDVSINVDLDLVY